VIELEVIELEDYKLSVAS